MGEVAVGLLGAGLDFEEAGVGDFGAVELGGADKVEGVGVIDVVVGGGFEWEVVFVFGDDEGEEG